MHAFQRWLLRRICEYLGLPQRARFLARPWPRGSLIAQHREPFPRDFTARGETLAWAKGMVRLLKAENRDHYQTIWTCMGEVLKDIAWGRWARYGYINGDLGNDILDEHRRIQGSKLNRTWKDLMERLALRLVPNRKYVHACAQLVLSKT